MADRICDNCMSRVPIGSEKCPKCGIRFENTNPGGALPNGWVLGERYTIGRYVDIDGEGVTYAAIDANTLQRVTIKEFMPVTLCATRTETGAIQAKPGCEVLFKTTRMDFSELYGILLRMGLVEGLIQVLDVLEANNTAYAVLEKVEGPTLSEYLAKRQGPIEPARAIALLRPVMAGVDAMHAANLVHRGISPDNIVLESGGTAKLGGFATLALRQQGSELKPKLYPGYSAPEQYAASEFEGRYTDIYALGAVLYRLVTTEVPFPANERKMQDTMRPARTWNKDVPPFLSAGLARAMRVIPAERIQSVSDLRLALSGEGGRTARGPLGLSKQQLIVAIAAGAAVLVLILVILLISLFSGGGKNPPVSSSLPASSSVSAASGEELPDFTGKLYTEVIRAYQGIYTFAEPTEEYSPDVEEGRIISQDPKKGENWDGETPIKLVVSLGVEPVTMPDFVSQHTMVDAAKKQLDDLKIVYKEVTQTNKGEYEPGTVIKTDPVAGTEIIPGKNTVILYVAGDVNTLQMPSLIGFTQTSAEAEMTRLGVVNVRIELVPNDGTKTTGTVESTEPSAGLDVAPAATVVTIRVYDKFYMPDLNAMFKDKPWAELKAYLDARHIGYTTPETVTNDVGADKNGLVADVSGYVINSEKTGTTTVQVKVYGDYVPPATP